MDRDLLAWLVASARTPDGPAVRAPEQGDLTRPAARGWLRLWSPRPHLPALPACECATGRCAACN